MNQTGCTPAPDRPSRVKGCAMLSRAGLPLLLAIFALCSQTTWAEGKHIRLRNELITTTSQKGGIHAQSTPTPVQGLYLIQFESSFTAAWRETLAAEHVELLRPVPDDAFIARLSGARLDRVRQLPFVRWIGEYQPGHKVLASVQTASKDPQTTSLSVGILLAPRLSPFDLAMARRMAGKVRRLAETRFGNLLFADVTPSQLTRLAQSKSVLWIESAPKPKLFDEIAVEIMEGETEPPGSALQSLGFDGKGVTVAVADSGLAEGDAATMHPDLAGRVDEFFFYGNLTDAADEHSHGTHVTGIIAGNGASGETDEVGKLYGLGMAPKAHIVVQRIFDGLGGYEAPPTFETLTHDAIRAGAEIGSNSWGDDTQGRYDLSAMEFDALVRDADKDTPGDQPYILEFSAGNAGPGERTIGSPAVAKNVIATGASQNNRFDFFIYAEGQESMADFSSRGPCEDGRIKPDVVAPGTWIASLQSSAASDENAWMPISPLYQYQGGTSQAGPHVSGAAAVFVQYYRETHGGFTPSPALVKAALINSAVDMENVDELPNPVPNNDEGWGRVDLTQLIGSERKYDFIDQTDLLATGQTYERKIILANADQPLYVTLVYTDVPGVPSAIPALVNDLDLELTAPDGTLYRGNQFLNGESTPNAPGTDRINNVESVFLSLPEVGEYTVRVRARNVMEDSRRETVAVDQDFALVISGALPLPGQGVIALDRKAYTAPSRANIKLVDLDLRGKPSANVTVRSTTETQGFTLTLQASGTSGAFTGSVAIAKGPPATDAVLQVKHGDQIDVIYQDASPSLTNTASASVDFVAPVISNVSATNQLGKQLIFWQTDEPANSFVRFGTNGNLSNVASNLTSAINHAVAIPDLTDGVTYQYLVISADPAGNTATNNNGGALFSFVATGAATVLLVDAYVHGPNDEGPFIPVTEYTSALAQTGVTFDTWDVTQNGSPQYNDLRPFRVVIWRINDSFYDTTTLSLQQQTVISNYVAAGGSFLMASMDILTRLGNVPFRTNLLQVREFIARTDPFADCSTCDEDHGVPSILGNNSDPITSGMEIALDYSNYPLFELEPLFPNIGPDLSDTFTPTTNAAPILTEPGSARKVAMRYPRTGQDSSGRVVFLSFPLDAVPMAGPSPNNRVTLLRNILAFLAPGTSGFGTIAFDSASYAVPSQVILEVADSDLSGKHELNLRIYSTTETNGQPIKLVETVRPGLFRGFISLQNPNDPSVTNRLKAKGHDLIWAEYLDNSSQSLIRASALVDTQAPVITNLSVSIISYETATITWDTSELADALVQFGESTFLSRTAYSADLTESHELKLTGLQANRTYYFQVVSRDEAGNTTVDDSKGRLYNFRTLKPYPLPWSDGFEQHDTNWTVISDESSSSEWQWGKASPAFIGAHSGSQVWGSNLGNKTIDLAETFLISPALDLTGGNTAKLTFWHNYDFTGESISEVGRLMISTNEDVAPVTLMEFGDSSADWEQVEVDLSPYIGRIVQFVWNYELIDIEFDPPPHPGWLVDDVAVTITNLLRGVVEVTNNIAQAKFTIAGPTPVSGDGWGLTYSNAITGEYVITFDPVPYYTTPPRQTNIVTVARGALFVGNYTFPDANRNGMSDVWEQEFFHEISTNRTSQTDTDQDGATDLAEFLAGTNPTNNVSSLKVLTPVRLSNGRVRLDWPSTLGRVYRVLGSSDGAVWTPFSGWLRSGGSQTSFTVPPLTGNNHLFKIQTAP